MTPFLGKKLSKTVFPRFRPFFSRKGQMLFDLNFEARFEIFLSFATYMTPFFLKFSNFDFWVPIVILKILIVAFCIVDTASQYVPARKSNFKFHCPWWNDECRNAIRERRRAQNRMCRDPFSEFLRIEYRQAEAKARRIIREAQITSWQELISVFNHRTPMAKLWEVLRKCSGKTCFSKRFPVLIQDDHVTDDPLEAANLFGQFFANMSGRMNYTAAFLEWEQELQQLLSDFGDDNNDDYNMPFSSGTNHSYSAIGIDICGARSITL